MTRTVTSASNFHRRVGCPASARIEAPLADVKTPWAERGTIMHDLWAHPEKDRSILTDEERANVEAVELADIEFCNQVFGENWPKVETFTETPVTLFVGLPEEMRSTPDKVYWLPSVKIIAVPDAKFGRIEVDEAADNWQIGIYLASLADRFPDAEIFYGIILQPWAKKSAPVQYTRADLEAMTEQISTVLHACDEPDAPFNPTPDNCRYCRGALHGVCPAYRKAALEPVGDASAVVAAIKDPKGFLLSLEPDKRARMLDALDMAADLRAVIRPAAGALLKEDKDAIPGWVKKRDTETRNISNLAGLAGWIERTGNVNRYEILDAAKLSIGAAEKLLKKATGLKGEDFEKQAEKILRPFVDVTPREGNLERE